jgi:hypothetical protein
VNRDYTARILCLTLGYFTAGSFAATEPKNSTTQPADAKQQVLDLSKEWVAAEIKHDANTLRRILDDKFVVSFGAEKPYNKEAFIKLIITGDVDPTESQTRSWSSTKTRQSRLALTPCAGQRKVRCTRSSTDTR